MSEEKHQSTLLQERDGDAFESGESAAVELADVRKEYGDIVAVDDIDLRIEPTEFFVLLGPSGCGKTTTLRMVAGLETPTSGRISIGDEEVTDMLPRHRDISMVFQSYALYPHKTVKENLRFPLNKMDLSSAEKADRIAATAEMLEIDDLLEKTPGQLSGGQRQRVAVGRTVVREPSVFLMDEPLSNLDAKLRVQTRSELRQLQQELETTTLYVTHDQEEAMSLADRMAIMNDGDIEQVGTPQEIYESPTNAFVAGFLGEPAINFLPVTDRTGGKIVVGSLPTGVFGDTFPVETERFGIRPEDIDVLDSMDGEWEDVDGKSAPVEFTVRFIEPLGNSYEIELTREETSLKAHTVDLPASVEEGSTVPIVFDLQNVLAFDANGDTITTEE
ncbi:ABC transporter ATP-binding protein [Halorarum halobium]|uniref:ABC transporter ATP-binding protein n=1 Tax=Halorarum halobium TaxID=3075121 RepID=UPI0028ABFE6D|nr:ABC transporter ATP-binding protein [Halobaculum sp. XH14]